LISLLGDWQAIARPYPDEVGVCYRFEGDVLVQHEPCIISAGYGAGAHYAILHWSDDRSTEIYLLNTCFDRQEFDAAGFCAYQLDENEAEAYERDVFLNVSTVDDPDNMTCYRAIATNESVCYRFSN